MRLEEEEEEEASDGFVGVLLNVGGYGSCA